MHIEIGIIEPARIAAANAAALALVATQLPALARAPVQIAKTTLAAATCAVLMQSWHVPVGPSELHLIGATTTYLLFGFAPTLVGFALGLLAQTLVEPQDLQHIGVNALSLMLPLVLVHVAYGRRLFAETGRERFSLACVLGLDVGYYAGVAAMVAFWLLISNEPFAVSAWAGWAVAYLPVFLFEALFSFATILLLRSWRRTGLVAGLTEIPRLRFA